MPPFSLARFAPLLGEFGERSCAPRRAQCIVSAECMLAEVLAGMNEASRGAWGWMAAVGLLVSMGMSWRLLPPGDVPESGLRVRDVPGLLIAVSRRPEFAFGFRNVLADVVWLQAIQVAGNRKLTPTEYDRLYVLLNVEADRERRARFRDRIREPRQGNDPGPGPDKPAPDQDTKSQPPTSDGNA